MQGETSISTEALIEALARKELAPWQDARVETSAYEAEMHRLNEGTHGIFLYRIDGADVELLAKPSHLYFGMLQGRAEVYRDFFREVLARAAAGPSFLLAVETEDRPGNSRFPTLSFQKNVGDPTILINDVNILECGYYEKPPFLDSRPFAAKLDKAVFVGSTSGAANTMATLAAGTNRRIESAKYFKDDARVDFWLPNVVQADAEAEAAIRALGLGDRIVGWDEQLGYKLLLSLDGNGAACQRLAVALKSNSAVVKYDSPSMLYYFSAMRPGVHYVPVASDAAVAELFDGGLDRLAEVAENGRLFFNQFLAREPSMAYAAAILAGVGRLLGTP